MTTKQKRAIWYSDRQTKLNKLEKMGLLKEYYSYKGKSKNHKIQLFCNAKGINL